MVTSSLSALPSLAPNLTKRPRSASVTDTRQATSTGGFRSRFSGNAAARQALSGSNRQSAAVGSGRGSSSRLTAEALVIPGDDFLLHPGPSPQRRAAALRAPLCEKSSGGMSVRKCVTAAGPPMTAEHSRALKKFARSLSHSTRDSKSPAGANSNVHNPDDEPVPLRNPRESRICMDPGGSSGAWKFRDLRRRRSARRVHRSGRSRTHRQAHERTEQDGPVRSRKRTFTVNSRT
jgi:hypothetical protein